MKYLSRFLIVLMASASLVACDVDEGPIEETGETIDQGIENTGDAAEEAADEAEEAFD